MCCCEKPTINGEMGYQWQPSNAPMVHPAFPPDVAADETILYDEPGRCGGLDSHSHHYRVTCRNNSSFYLRVRHGAGDDAVHLNLYGKGLKEMLAALDSNSRYWLLNEMYSIHRNAEILGREAEGYKWREAAAQKRIKTRKQPARGTVKVWIEPAAA